MHIITDTSTTQPRPSSSAVRLCDEDGAQSIEYAALAGGGIAIITVLTELLRSEPVQDAIRDFLTGLFEGLAGSLGNLF